ncbi:MAG: GNAT family N-acetyltransferase [Robiginitomaculum sp.]|nr:GNAT family N-acetyltransferase [Robiginitomaculum sp.]
MSNVELIEAGDLGASERALWRSLRQSQESLSSPYFSDHWIKEVALVRDDVKIAVLLQGNGRITGFLPFQQLQNGIALPVGGALNDYHGVIAKSDFRADFEQIMKQINVKRFDFSSIPATQKCLSPYAWIDQHSHIIDISNGLNAYLQQRKQKSSARNYRAKKRERKLVREIGELRLEIGSKDQRVFDTLLHWKRNQYAQTNTPDVFAGKWTRNLVQNLFERSKTDEFGAILFALYAKDKLIACNYCLGEKDVLHSWFIAYNHEFAKYSPGLVLFEKMIEHLADTHIREIDLGTGNYRFKTSLANNSRLVSSGFVGSSRFASLIPNYEYRFRKWAELMPLGSLSELPGKAMRRIDLHRGLA